MPLITSPAFFVPPYIPWDISTSIYDNKSVSGAAQDLDIFEGSAAKGVFLKNDGTKMYMLGNNTRAIYQYTLSTPWDVSTATYDIISFSVAGEVSGANGYTFSPDGTRIFVPDSISDAVYSYTLSTAWDLTTASYDSLSFSVAAQSTTPIKIAFKTDGTKMFIQEATNKLVYQYTLSTPWDVSTSSYDNISFSFATETGSIVSGLFFRNDGRQMFITSNSNRAIYQYTLSTPWDVSTATYDIISFSVAGECYLSTIFIREDGSQLFMMTGYDVFQYTIP